MAVTLDITQLEARIQSGLLVTGDMAVNDELDGLLATAAVMVETWCPEAPDAVMNEAAVRIVGYLVDRPSGAQTHSEIGEFQEQWSSGSTNAMYHSGAGALLSQWTPIRVAGEA